MDSIDQMYWKTINQRIQPPGIPVFYWSNLIPSPTGVKVKNIDTKQSNKGNNQNSKDKTITWNKETQMAGQHEPLWKSEVKSGVREG